MEPCVGDASCDVPMGVAGSGGREISLSVLALLVCLPLLVAALCGLGIFFAYLVCVMDLLCMLM